MTLTRQMFARRTPSPKEHSLALLTHLMYYLCGRPKMNNRYYFLLTVININKLFYKILWPKFEARTDDSTISAHTICSPYYLPPFSYIVSRQSMCRYILSSLKSPNVGSFSGYFPTESSPLLWLTPSRSLIVVSPIFFSSALVRALFGQRPPARAANEQF